MGVGMRMSAGMDIGPGMDIGTNIVFWVQARVRIQ